MVRVWRFAFCVAGRMTLGSKPPHEPGSRPGRIWPRPAITPALTRSVRRTCLAVTVAALTALVPPPSEAQSPALFTAVNETPPPGPLGTETVRSRLVTMNLGQVQHAQAAAASGPSSQTRDPSGRADKSGTAPAPGTLLTLNLFDDVVVTGVVEWTAPTFSGGYSVAGHLLEEPLGTLTLVVNGETVAGTVRTLGETYQIRSVGDALYTISEVEEHPLDCGVEGPHSETDHPH